MATHYEHSTLGQLAAQDLGVKVTQKEIKSAILVADTAATWFLVCCHSCSTEDVRLTGCVKK
ncbi:hypothetical protein [Alicyclobacillus sp. ALC3]|uniref:hypothetical protein n=1 Tax=Alicyclobacillus sp. ALC3 TaxID=2796143 RepID=UPI002377E995|nr:hypothetical protein [Alicyclobacillus sp. ALC3]WDL98108.1 hypothetical protein JC200_05250 [Alicyclobacillus sp. ALC3]